MIFGSPPIVTNGLVLNLDAGNTKSYPRSGTVWSDMSGFNNSGSLVNGPTYNSLNGGNILFDGTDDYTSISDSTVLRPSAFTLDSWFRATSFSAYNVLLCKPFTAAPWSNPFLSYMTRLYNNGTVLHCGVSTGGSYRQLDVNYTFSTNTIYNVLFTFDSSTGAAVAYLNGNVIGSTTLIAGSISYTTFPVLVGAGYGSSPVGELFAGNMYTARIYNRVLSLSEITQNYNALKSRFNL